MTTPTYAKPPSRKTAAFNLQLTDMVMLPLDAFAALESDENTGVERHQYVKGTNHPVGRSQYDKITNKPVKGDEIVMCVSVGDKLVELTNDEMASCSADDMVDKTAVQIEDLVPLAQVGSRYIPRAQYQLRATPIEVGKTKKPNDAVNKVLRVLCAWLDKKNVGLLLRVPLRGAIARYAVLMPDARLVTLYFDEEIREQREWPEADIKPKDLATLDTLLGDLDVTTPVIVNAAGEKIRAYAERKAAEGLPTPESTDAEVVVNETIDYMAALEASVATKKPRAKKKVA